MDSEDFEDKLLVANSTGGLTPFSHWKTNGWGGTFKNVVIVFFMAGIIGVLVWLIIEFEKEKKYHCQTSKQTTIDDYTIFHDRAAEPYNGPIQSALTPSTVEECKSACTTNSCTFFTYHSTTNACYMYDTGILPYQHSKVAIVGPSDKESSVYVLSGTKVTIIDGVENVEKQTA